MGFKQLFLKTNQYISEKLSTKTAKDNAFLLGALGGVATLANQQTISSTSDPVILGSLALPLVAIVATKTIAQVSAKIAEIKKEHEPAAKRKF